MIRSATRRAVPWLGRRPAPLRLRRVRRALGVARLGRGPGGAAPAGAPGAAQRDAAHRPGSPRLRHRGRLSLRGRRGALRDARSARLRPLPGAHALQGHRQASARATWTARWRAWAGRSNAVTSFDYTSFYLVLPSDATDVGHRAPGRHGLPLELRSPRRSAASARSSSRRRASSTDNPRSAIVRQLYGLVFAGNPYGRPVLGTRPTMKAATQERLRAFNRRYYIAGEHDAGRGGPGGSGRGARHRGPHVRRGAGHRLQAAPAPAPAPLAGGVRRTVERREQQAHLALGWQAPRSDDPNGDAVDLLTTILAGTESSRLAQRLRDEERLVSTVTMSYSALMGGGIVSLRAELEAKDLERVEQHHPGGDRADPGERAHRGGAPLAVTKFEAAARLRHRDLRGPRLRLRPRRDHLDARGGAALRGPAPAQSPASRSATRRAAISRAPTTRGWPSCRSRGRR